MVARSQRQATGNVTLQAPTGGINTVDPLHGMSALDSIYTYNIDGSAYGLTVRPGYREHSLATGSIVLTTGAWVGSFTVGELVEDDVTDGEGIVESAITDTSVTVIIIAGTWGTNAMTGVTSGATATISGVGVEDLAMAGTTGIRTIVPFSGIAEDDTNDKLFAVTDDGIYDISGGGAIQQSNIVYDWASGVGVGGLAGWCSYTQYSAISGANYILLCDQKNGYMTYTESTDTWAVGSLTGATAADMRFVMVWKNRIWFVEKDSNSSWYFDTVGAIAGAVSEFTFGNKFKYGGHLVGLYNWSRDSGTGPDDYLVALSHGGDLVIYEGTDPNSANTFGIVGVWFIGKLPAGRRVAEEYGGDLLVLSTFGLLSTNSIMGGAPPNSKEANLAWKISRFMNSRSGLTEGSYGWEVKLHPKLKKIIVNTPDVSGNPDLQFVLDLDTWAWGMWRGMDMTCSEVWEGTSYYGEDTNQVFKIEGNLDNVLLYDEDASEQTPINFSFLTSFQDFGLQGLFKRAQYIRAMFISEGLPSYEVEARYDFDLTEAELTSIAIVSTGALWDTAIWDSAVWGGGVQVLNTVSGASGMGRHIAVACRGSTAADTTLVAIDLMFDSGGLL